MQAASINTSPNMAQYHSSLALKLIVIFFCVSPSINEKTSFCETMYECRATVFLMLLCSSHDSYCPVLYMNWNIANKETNETGTMQTLLNVDF
jgi:hypothetical protein